MLFRMTLKSSWAEWWLRSFLFLLSLIPGLCISAADREAKELRLGYFPNITHAQALYARATGEFEKKTGVQIKWTAFNAGPDAVSKWGGTVPPYAETQDYVRKVIALYFQYKDQVAQPAPASVAPAAARQGQ